MKGLTSGFPKLKAAREALREKAGEIYQKYMTLIDTAIAAQDFETAEKALRFLAEHIPADEDGVRLLDPSVDKAPPKAEPRQQAGVKVGIMIGGTQAKALPSPVIIDVKDEDESTD